MFDKDLLTDALSQKANRNFERISRPMLIDTARPQGFLRLGSLKVCFNYVEATQDHEPIEIADTKNDLNSLALEDGTWTYTQSSENGHHYVGDPITPLHKARLIAKTLLLIPKPAERPLHPH